ncbi:MAG: methylated-DNA--[protein]-cysteine S-methyltransferase [Cyanobacteria bacterium J06600_6]
MIGKKTFKGGQTREVAYAVAQCTLGYLLVATTEKGICTVKLGDRSTDLIGTLKGEFGNVTLAAGNFQRDWIEPIIASIKGTAACLNLPLDIQGTDFQRQVWQALRKIPYGETRTYKDIAIELDKPNATRAIGSACGANPVALVIPCHRVLRSDGGLGGYRWGVERKIQLLEIEMPNILLLNSSLIQRET